MALSDPTPGVPTPTGTLQGVAVFSWDGSAWQPAGRAGPGVATPTGVLRGVAAFNADSGATWQPLGRAGPGIATPTGVLEGVAVHNWDGSAWRPQWTQADGWAINATPSGALRGVAVFNWDGAAWQPAGQAGPSVSTPYGVLDGVAMFYWDGSSWAPSAAPTLDLSFMTPGTLDPRITFTRASVGTYFDAAGVLQTATTNTPRWDYDPATHVLRGMLVEEARTNLLLDSADIVSANWIATGLVVAAPTITANQLTAPDGTVTAERISYPQVIGANAASFVRQQVGATAAVYAWSIYLRGSVGGEQLYVDICDTTPATFYSQLVTLTTAWQRFTFISPTLTAASWNFRIGTDLRAGGESTKPACVIYAWGGQVEVGANSTSYIATSSAAATRAVDVANITPLGAWFNASTGTLMLEFDATKQAGVAGGFSSGAFANVYYLALSTSGIACNVASVGYSQSGQAVLANGSVIKMAASYSVGRNAICNNGSAVFANATLPAGPYPWTSNLAFGNAPWQPTGTASICGHMRRARYWPRALSNVELQSVTT